MNSRPTSVTYAAWFVIVVNILGVFGMAYGFESQEVWDAMALNLLPVVVQRSLIMFTLGISILCGFMMLDGRPWARKLYIGFNGVSLLIQLVSAADKLMLLPAILIFGALVYFLLRPQANDFFAGKFEPEEAADETGEE